MALRTQSDLATERISVRLQPQMESRVSRVVRKSKRTKTSVLIECVEAYLPVLEKQYARFAEEVAE